jgi:hypothetical protein
MELLLVLRPSPTNGYLMSSAQKVPPPTFTSVWGTDPISTQAIAFGALWSLTSFWAALDELQSMTVLEESMQSPTDALAELPPPPHAPSVSAPMRQIEASA